MVSGVLSGDDAVELITEGDALLTAVLDGELATGSGEHADSSRCVQVAGEHAAHCGKSLRVKRNKISVIHIEYS